MDDKNDKNIKNQINNSEIEVGGNMHLGDNITHIHNYAEKEKPKDSDFKKTVKNFLTKGEIGKAINALVDNDTLDDDLKNTVYLLSGRYHGLQRRVTQGVITEENANIETNRINSALLSVIKDL